MLLYIVRHAWAGEHGDPSYPDDRLRPLTGDGRKRFAKVAAELRSRGVAPETIATSPLLRCRQTAEILAESCKGKPAVEVRTELEPGSNLASLVNWSSELQLESLAWVGHAPDVGDLTAALIGDGGAGLHFAKGAVALLEFPDQPAPGQGMLRWLVTAKVLGV